MKGKKIMNKKGVFGLTSVQAFFAIILAVGLLAYVIVIIMGTLNSANIISTNTNTDSVTNETVSSVTEVPVSLAKSTLNGVSCTITQCVNSTNGKIISAGNRTFSGCTVASSGENQYNNTNWKCTYTYGWSSYRQSQNAITTNVSSGVSGFFGSINPVYAILAVLVIILVLVVLVRVVTGGETSRTAESPGIM